MGRKGRGQKNIKQKMQSMILRGKADPGLSRWNHMSSQRCLFEVDKGDNTDGRENTEVLTEAGNVKTEQREVGPQAKECQ